MLRFLSLPSAMASFIVLFLLSWTQPAQSHLIPRSENTLPAPISFPPAQNWEGVDGSWNTFVLQVGNPVQIVRVMISTTSQQIWTIQPAGCPGDNATNSVCAESRGDFFQPLNSSTWQEIGLYDLWIEKNLGYYGNAEYGYDSVGLGYPGEGGITLENQTIGALAVESFYFGHLGIHPKPTNFTNFTSQSPSFVATLKDQGDIPSLSWGYTAGAPYRFAKVLASLTFGGYDSARFIPNGVSFPFAPNNERDLLVSITGVRSADGSGTTNTLSSSPIYSYIDSTIAELWMPVDVCEQFEQAFNLTWDDTTQLYLLSDAQRNALLVQNPNITITVAPYDGSAGSVDITLPYAAFDQTASPPYRGLQNASRYFPLRRAYNDTQYTLGRTFLQEAYLAVDWERQNFTLAQCDWIPGAPQNLVAIAPLNNTGNGGAGRVTPGGEMHGSPLATGAIVGIAVGCFAILALSVAGVLLYLRRKTQKSRAAADVPPKSVDSDSSRDSDPGVSDESTATNVYPKAELDATEPNIVDEKAGFYKPHAPSIASSQVGLFESDSKEREVFEMPGDMPTRQEADGRGLSEKEAIRVREERINGTDPAVSPVSPGGSDRSPTSTLATGTLPSSITSRTTGNRTLITPGEVLELNVPLDNGTMQLVSPLESSDGQRTMMFTTMSPMSPINGINGSAPVTPDESTRKRFSYEDPV